LAAEVGLATDQFRELRIPVGFAPTGAVQMILGLPEGIEPPSREVRVNGVPGTAVAATELAVPSNVARLLAFAVPAGTVGAGESVVEVRNAGAPVQIVWAELLVMPKA